MLKEIPEEMPDWAVELVQDLETASSTRGGCEHGRSAYDDAAFMVVEYWEKSQDGDFTEEAVGGSQE